MTFRLATVQFRPDKGRIDQNLDRMAEAVAQATQEGADLVLFPESAPTGYILEGGVEPLALTPEKLAQEFQSRLPDLNRPVDIVTGFYQSAQGQSFNSAAYLLHDQGQTTVHHVYQKLFLPTYHVFDEARFHQPGNQLGLVETRFGKIGLLICEDLWHSILGSLLTVAGAELVLVPAASPARGFADPVPANIQAYQRLLPSLAAEHGIYAAIAMLTGFEGGKGFYGNSMVVSPFGETLVQTQGFENEILIADIDLAQIRQARQNNPLATDLKANWTLIQRLASQVRP